MKTQRQNHFTIHPGITFTPNPSNPQYSDTRQVIGLPKLADTEKNRICMYNTSIESEAGRINKLIGNIDAKDWEYHTNPSCNPGIGSEFGY